MSNDMHIKAAKYLSSFIFISLHSPLVSAAPPVDASSLLNQEENIQDTNSAPLPAPQKELELPKRKKLLGNTIEIKALRFSGATELLSGEEINLKIQKLTANSIGQKFDFNRFQTLIDHITVLLKREGWLLARAYLPQQDVSKGIVNISILRGQLDSQGQPFIIENISQLPLRINPKIIKNYASQYLKPGTALNESELERALLLIGDLPGIDARARLEAGDEQESTRIHLLTTQEPIASALIQTNNFGNRFTGRSQLQSKLSLKDLEGRGDQVDIALTISEGTHLGQFSYTFPIGYKGWSANFSYTSLDYKVIDGNASKQAKYDGKSESYASSLRYPLVRSSDKNVWLKLGYRADRFHDRFNKDSIANKRILSANISLQGDSLDQWQGGGRSNWSLNWRNGDLDLSHLAQQQQNDDSSYNKSGTFNKLEYSLSRHQRLTSDLSLYLNLNGQFSSKNLDSSQKFFPGGPNGVRAYPGSEASADEGQLFKAELRYNVNNIPKDIGDIQLLAFYDQAWVRRSNSHPSNVPILNAANSNKYHLSGAGLGLLLTKGDQYSLNFSWAKKLGSNPGRSNTTGFDSDEQKSSSRFWLQGAMQF